MQIPEDEKAVQIPEDENWKILKMFYGKEKIKIKNF